MVTEQWHTCVTASTAAGANGAASVVTGADGADGVVTGAGGADGVVIGADGADGVVTGADGVVTGADGADRMDARMAATDNGVGSSFVGATDIPQSWLRHPVTVIELTTACSAIYLLKDAATFQRGLAAAAQA